MSNFAGLNTALSGLRASQLGLDTASHNVANANTDGFTRQRVGLTTARPYASAVGPMGTGVTVTGISRLRDAFLDARVRTTLGGFAYESTSAQLLGRVEAALGEPDTGLSTALSDLWGSFEDLALDPTGPGPRQQVIGALDNLAGRVRSVQTGWEQLGRDTRQRLGSDVAEVNDLTARVAELNRLIPQQAGVNGQQPSDLLDERDRHVDRLAELVGGTVTAVDEQGRVTVSAGGVDLVAGLQARPLEAHPDGRVGLRPPEDPAPLPLSGQVGAISTFLAEQLPELQADFATVVNGLVEQLNTQHALGSGGTGGPLLELDGDGRLRVTATAGDLAPGLGTAPHDSSNAQALAGLRFAAFDGVQTVEQAYSSFVVDVASRVATSSRSADAQHSLAVAAASARFGQHSVSLDEEMADVVRFQRSLEAMSRVMSAIDEALNVLVNRTGIVGR
jgi:flagellar hook-associated protein 1